jgi:hypothetical protein
MFANRSIGRSTKVYASRPPGLVVGLLLSASVEATLPTGLTVTAVVQHMHTTVVLDAKLPMHVALHVTQGTGTAIVMSA